MFEDVGLSHPSLGVDKFELPSTWPRVVWALGCWQNTALGRALSSLPGGKGSCATTGKFERSSLPHPSCNDFMDLLLTFTQMEGTEGFPLSRGKVKLLLGQSTEGRVGRNPCESATPVSSLFSLLLFLPPILFSSVLPFLFAFKFVLLTYVGKL